MPNQYAMSSVGSTNFSQSPGLYFLTFQKEREKILSLRGGGEGIISTGGKIQPSVYLGVVFISYLQSCYISHFS